MKEGYICNVLTDHYKQFKKIEMTWLRRLENEKLLSQKKRSKMSNEEISKFLRGSHDDDYQKVITSLGKHLVKCEQMACQIEIEKFYDDKSLWKYVQ